MNLMLLSVENTVGKLKHAMAIDSRERKRKRFTQGTAYLRDRRLRPDLLGLTGRNQPVAELLP